MKAITLFFLALALTASVWAEEPGGATLTIGKDLTYTRGTSRAKEELLEFPYHHSNNKRECWAYVVHEGKNARVIFKKSDVEGEKKENEGDLINQDFPPDHPFQKVLDRIKLDALINVYKDAKESAKTEKGDWQILSGNSAVNRKFFKNSEGRYYCVVGVYDPKKESVSQPLIMSFKRSNQGPMATMVDQQGSLIGVSHPASANVGTNAVFNFLETRNGF